MMRINKKITAVLFLLIFVLMPSAVLARDCSHCWCYDPWTLTCEHHTQEDTASGAPILTDTQCNSYCAWRTTDGHHWQAKHCDEDYIDWSKDKTDPYCYDQKAADAEAAAAAKTVPFTPIEPALQIPDFNIQFSKLVVSEIDGQKFISVPWLAEYIAAIYRYLVGVATILAIVMIMYGGFRWVTAAGDSGKISEAKKTITGAVMGLILALGSYTVLNLINPDLVSFNSLQLGLVARQEFTSAVEIITPDKLSDYPDVTGTEAEASAVGLYEKMLSSCLPADQRSGHDTEFYRQQFIKVIKDWAALLPGQAVYVKGGRIKNGECLAASDNFFKNKFFNGQPDIQLKIDSYRNWAKTVTANGGYCADCGTFAATIVDCVKGVFYNPQFNTSDAIYSFPSLKEFIASYKDGSTKLQPGDSFWIKGDCNGHAITYTGGSGAGFSFEMIEMGGYYGPKRANNVPDWDNEGHPASVGTKNKLIDDYLQPLSNKNEQSGKACKVWIMRPY